MGNWLTTASWCGGLYILLMTADGSNAGKTQRYFSHSYAIMLQNTMHLLRFV